MASSPLKYATILAEYQVILETLQKTDFNKSKAAEVLGIDRSSLNNKIKKYKALKQAESNPISETV